jgi:hypothetical protein
VDFLLHDLEAFVKKTPVKNQLPDTLAGDWTTIPDARSQSEPATARAWPHDPIPANAPAVRYDLRIADELAANTETANHMGRPMKAKRSVLCILTLATVIGFARAEESGTKMRITPLTPWGSPIGDSFSIPCAGSRCRGPWRLNVAGVPYRFEVMALFAPGRATIALEPVPNESGRVIFLSQNARDPIVLPTDQRGVASKTVALTEVSEAETRSVIKHPVLRLGTLARVRIDVVGPGSE